MADNVEANAGSGGAVFATDDDGTAHHPYVKVEFGADNTQTPVSTSNPLPVDIRAENASVTVDNGGTFAVQVDGDALTALQLIDNIVQVEDAAHGSGDSGVMPLAVRNDTLAALGGADGDYAPIQVNASGALYIQEGAAMDVSAATVTVDNGGTFAVQVDGDALTALQLIDNIVQSEDAAHNSGDAGVMPLAVRNDTLAALGGTDGDYAPLQVNASGALFIQEGAALDVSASTVTVDATGQGDVPVTLAGEAVTLGASDGTDIGDVDVASHPSDTFVAEGGALGKGVLIQGDDGTDRTNVLVDTSGHLQVDVVGSLPAGTNAIGKLAANSGVDIGDVDILSAPARDRTTDNQGVALQTDAIMDDTTALTPKFAVIDDASSGDNTVIAAVSGKKIRVLGYVLVAAGTTTVRFEDGAGGTALTGQMSLVANTGVSSGFNPVGWFETSVDTLLNLELSAAVSVDGHITYVEV